jgi:DNA-binding transcriptional ArsR family regulator
MVALSDGPSRNREPRGRRGWTFLTNHGIVTLMIAQNPHIRMSEMAERTGLSRRAVQMIVTDLAEAGYITRRRVGRRNTYTVNADQPGPRPEVVDVNPPTLRSLLRILGDDPVRQPDVAFAGSDS